VFNNGDIPDLYGSCTASIKEMIEGKKMMQIKNGDQNCGQLKVLHVKAIIVPTFIDYLRSGWGLSFATAIDFTASNGEPS
jgi:hypothetical protein